MVQKLSHLEGEELLETNNMRGLFFYEDVLSENNLFIGIDNSKGDLFTEEFSTIETCVRWLLNPFEYHSETDFGNQHYEVEITQTFRKPVIVYAKNEADAKASIIKKWGDGEIRFNDADYIDYHSTEFKVYGKK